MIRMLLFLSLVPAFYSCGVVKSASENRVSLAAENTETIVFLVFKMNKNPNGKSSITMVSKTEVSGKLKKNDQIAPDSENYLTVDVYRKGRSLQTMFINHPLYKVVEYVDEDNKFRSKKVEAEEGEFFFRIQLSGETKISISETLQNKPKTELITIKL